MIRIIDSLQAQSLDGGDGQWTVLPLVPATGTIETSESSDDGGRLVTVKVAATLFSGPDIIHDNLSLKVGFCGGDTETYGTEDLPLALDVSRSDTVKVSCTYKFPLI
jgi:hypothetical protein